MNIITLAGFDNIIFFHSGTIELAFPEFAGKSGS